MIDYIFGALVFAVLFLIVAVVGLYMAVSRINKDMYKIPLLKQRFIRWGEIYKTSVLTVWLGWSGYLMYEIYNNPILLKNTNDIWSNLIAVIGIIVATLIGWQIYSAMDWNSKAERLSRLENANQSITTEIKNNRFFSEASVHFIQGLLTYTEANTDPEKNKNDYVFAYKSFLRALSLYVGPSIEDPVEECISYLHVTADCIRRYEADIDDDFHSECEKHYETIKGHKEHLTKAQQGKVEQVHKKRTAIKVNVLPDTEEE